MRFRCPLLARNEGVENEMTLMEALDAWEPALRRVAAAKAEMEAGHYYRPLREAYEAACADRDALGARIEALSAETTPA